MRTFWASGESELEVLSSSMEAYFDFDTLEGDGPASVRPAKTPFIMRIGQCGSGKPISCGAAFDSGSSALGRTITMGLN